MVPITCSPQCKIKLCRDNFNSQSSYLAEPWSNFMVHSVNRPLVFIQAQPILPYITIAGLGEIETRWTMSVPLLILKIYIWGTSTFIIPLTFFPLCKPKLSWDNFSSQPNCLAEPWSNFMVHSVNRPLVSSQAQPILPYITMASLGEIELHALGLNQWSNSSSLNNRANTVQVLCLKLQEIGFYACLFSLLESVESGNEAYNQVCVQWEQGGTGI